jgi:ribosomal protein S18 acetylase RimI-like enzyme
MLQRVLATAETRYPAVSLSVSVSNPARRLYEREGFVPVSRSEDGAMTMVKVFGP